MGASIAVTANSMGTLKKYIAIFPFSATILVGSVLCGVVYSRSLSCACFVKLNIEGLTLLAAVPVRWARPYEGLMHLVLPCP